MRKYRKYIIGGAGVVILFLFCYYFFNIVWWLLLSAFIAALASPIVKLLDKIHIGKLCIPRWISAMTTVGFIWLLIAIFCYFAIPFLASQVNQFKDIDIVRLQEGFNQPIQDIDRFIQSYPILGMPDFSTEEVIVEKINDVINFSELNKFARNIGNTALSIFLGIFSITFFTYFFLKDTHLFRRGIMSLVPTTYEDKASRIFDKLPGLIKNYLHGIFFEMLSVTILITVGLLICRLSFGLSFLIGIICGLLNIIPYLGPWIGAAIGVIFIGTANIELDFYAQTMPQVYCLLIVVVIVRLIDDFVFQPFFYSRSVNAHPLEIFIVIIVAGNLYGIVGMMLAIPVYTVIRVIAKEFFSEYKFVRQITKNIDNKDKNQHKSENNDESL